VLLYTAHIPLKAVLKGDFFLHLVRFFLGELSLFSFFLRRGRHDVPLVVKHAVELHVRVGVLCLRTYREQQEH
jgi:hypothetical protein